MDMMEVSNLGNLGSADGRGVRKVFQFGMFAEKNWPTAVGRPGSAVVQIVDSGSWATFDCHMTVFNKITDYHTGHHVFLKMWL